MRGHVLPLVIAVIIAAASSGFGVRAFAQDATPGAGCAATSEEENAAIALRWHNDVINDANLEVVDQIVAPDVVHHAGTFPDGVGPDAVKKVLGALLTGFPDVQHTVEAVITDDDLVVTRWVAKGTHDGVFQGHEATGKPVTWTGMNMFRIECGKIAEEWSEVDGVGRLAQITAAATPTP